MASPSEGPGGLFPTPIPTFSAGPTAHSSAPSARPCRRSPACWTYDEYDDRDASKDLRRPCHGWPQLVEVMAEQPGLESFQAFRDLNIKSLLYYQAELAQLRKELHALEWEDHRKGGDPAEFCENIRALLATKKDSIECQEQISKVNQIRVVLKDYNAALLQYAEINKLPNADIFNVKTLRRWIDANISESLNIRGPGSDSWGTLAQIREEDIGIWRRFYKMLKSIFKEERSQEDHFDLVVPGKEEHIDSFFRWVVVQGIPFWHNLKIALKRTRSYQKVAQLWRFLGGPFRRTNEERRSEEHLPRDAPIEKNPRDASIFSTLKRRFFQQRTHVENKEEDNLGSVVITTYRISRVLEHFTGFVMTTTAYLFPIIGIVVLSQLHTKTKILSFIALFTAIFAIGIMVFTDSRTSRTDVFTATAAFAAVLIVFVQNQSPVSGGG